MEQKPSVVVTDVQMPFWSMVVFLIKLAFASIPAIIVVWTVTGLIVLATFTGLSGLGYALNQAAAPAPTATPTPAASPRK